MAPCIKSCFWEKLWKIKHYEKGKTHENQRTKRFIR